MTNVPEFYLDFNVVGAERKRLVKVISEYMRCDAEYLRAPTFAYAVGCFTISRDGVMFFDSRTNPEEIRGLISNLSKRGFVPYRSYAELQDDELDEEQPADFKSVLQHDSYSIVVELPNEAVSMDNLMKLLKVKGRLIKKALGLNDLPVEQRKDTVAFPWFPDNLESDEIQARIHFVAAICEMSKWQKRVSVTEKAIGNEKYAFRCFLLRLGFIGEQYKAERKILLKNLTGSSAYK